MTRLIAGSLAVVILVVSLGRVEAAYPNMAYSNMAFASMQYGMGCGMGCSPCMPSCVMQMQTVQRTVMCPVMTMETRTVSQTLCRQETRQSTYTAMISVPVQQQVTRQYCTMVPQTQTKTVNYTVCQTVMKPQECSYCVTVPETKTVSATRQVCRMVPVVTKKTITEDHGCWQTVPCVPTCGTCVDSMPMPAMSEPMSPSDLPKPMAGKDSEKSKSQDEGVIKQVGLRRVMRSPVCCVPCAPAHRACPWSNACGCRTS